MEKDFNLTAALRYLERRHPKLKDCSTFQQLLHDQECGWEHVIPVFQELFVDLELNPAVCTAFRKVLLRLVGGWVGQQQGLEVQASIALLNAVFLVPHLERAAVDYFKRSRCPLDMMEDCELPMKKQICFASLHAIRVIPEIKGVWGMDSWAKLLKDEVPEVRYCGLRATSVLLGLTDAISGKLVGEQMTKDRILQCALEFNKYIEWLDFEKDFKWILSSARQEGADDRMLEKESSDGCATVLNINELALPSGYVGVCGLVLPKRPQALGASISPSESWMVITPTVKSNLQSAALALCQNRPLLLEGPPGSGKTCLIRQLATQTGHTDMVHVHIDDQTDSKSLLGAYICTATPGEFVWQPGPLTQAVSHGKWLVIEDVNLAPPQVLVALIPLLERGSLHIPQRAETIKAAPGFQILATVTCSPAGLSAGAYPGSDNVKEILGGLWSQVYIENPPLEEQLSILEGRFPELHNVLPFIMALLHLVQLATAQTSPLGEAGIANPSHSLDFSAMHQLVQASLEANGILDNSMQLHVGRHFSLRDAVKWCWRMKAVHGNLISQVIKLISSEDYGDVTRLPFAVREAAFIEACDCFASLFQDELARHKLMLCFASIWALTQQEVDNYKDLHKPQIKVAEDSLLLGRIRLSALSRDLVVAYQRKQANQSKSQTQFFSHTGHAARMMEKVAVAVNLGEPILLVGDTGSGKTSLVQHIAEMVGAKLMVLNLSQQSGSSDLLGGFKPVSLEDSMRPLVTRLVDLIRATWTRGNNETFIRRIMKNAERGRWKRVEEGCRAAIRKMKQSMQECGSDSIEEITSQHGKRRKTATNFPSNKKARQDSSACISTKWQKFEEDLLHACHLRTTAEAAFAFAFMEGCLIKAMKNGWWLLLDEINLAPPEVLECLAGVLDPDSSGSVTLAELGIVAVERHKNFRIIGAMNPATDIGKRDLPPALRNRFTELWYPEPQSTEDLAMIASTYLQGFGNSDVITKTVEFYRAAKIEAVQKTKMNLLDGGGHRPAYNLRTFCRWLLYTMQMARVYGLPRSLYDGVSMAFSTQLDASSAQKMESTVRAVLLDGRDTKDFNQVPREPAGGRHILFEQFWVEYGDKTIDNCEDDSFILTKSVRANLKNLARAVVLRKFPVLLQGPTSSGKTSMVFYLAKKTGHTLIRINNHEHTDLQEYLGTYIADETGKLVFREGALVQAVRKGYWVVLDELNLAPTEVLEALNRLLDDNRELFIPETQETIKPHPQFMLYATQNPPGLYAGRKMLSRAFKSRFLEVHVDDIPDDELAVILENRCRIAPSYAAKLIVVMKDLQRRRQASNAFAGKHGFITPRDLFKWADREAVGYQQLAENGYIVLAERLRREDEKMVVKDVLEKTMRVEMNVEDLYEQEGGAPALCLQKALEQARNDENEIPAQRLNGIVWTKSMSRMYSLVSRCLESKEPALLVGETGSGKTTVCQMLALMRGQKLHILNCNQHTETSDFLGGFRPARDRERAVSLFHSAARDLVACKIFDELNQARPSFPESLAGFDLLKEALKAKQSVEDLRTRGVKLAGSSSQSSTKQLTEGLAYLDGVVGRMTSAAATARTPFSWVDGPLVEAMKRGDILLVDELNLAEDAVVERMNSVMETSRTLTLAEKGGDSPEVIVAAEGFRLVATMNPGGDYGKKELSPALSNRFTQIWVPQIEDVTELEMIVEANLSGMPKKEIFKEKIMEFWSFFYPLATSLRMALTVRDLLAWVGFINALSPSLGSQAAYVHGCFLVLLDGLGLGSGTSQETAQTVRFRCCEFLTTQLNNASQLVQEASGALMDKNVTKLDGMWGIEPFVIACGPHSSCGGEEFSLEAPTPMKNTFRLLRALQLKKSILLEGSPGVGKTSLVAAVARMSDHRLTRINLSEQTDMMDLLGADLPVPGGGPGEFRWCDGPLLAAIKSGDWVLIDELNLATQQVLEGLNSVLDHRSEVFIPELGKTYQCHPGFRLFGAQNPLQEGGGRKGLPRSFLNRFTRVHVEALSAEDMSIIAGCLYPRLSEGHIQIMVTFLATLHRKVCIEKKIGLRGGPWEFNLRDLLRWCHLVDSALPQESLDHSIVEGVLEHLIQTNAQNLFVNRFRTLADRKLVGAILKECSGSDVKPCQPDIAVTPSTVQIGGVSLQRRTPGILSEEHGKENLHLLSGQRRALESVATGVAHAWPCLIIGNPASGKNSIVRVLAQLCCRTLTEIALTQGTDTSDLLGGFEQMEIPRMIKEIRKDCKKLLNSVIDAHVGSQTATGNSPNHVPVVTKILTAWATIESAMANRLLVGSASSKEELTEELADLSKFISDVNSLCEDILQSSERLLAVTSPLEGRISRLQGMCSSSERSCLTAGRFEWVDGALCRAMENGDWVLLDNANLCNPTVLDRLNSVLEQNGVLYLNECGGVTREPRVIKPHPEFRLFLSYNSQYGEVSRAMRNRGLELFLLPEDEIEASDRCDVSRILFSEGITAPRIREAITDAHFEADERTRSGALATSTTRDVKQWSALADLLVSRGLDAHVALSASWNQVYVRRQTTKSAKLMAEDILLQFCLEKIQDNRASVGATSNTLVPAGGGITVQTYCEDSAVATIESETSVFKMLGSQLNAAEAIDSLTGDDDSTAKSLLKYVHQLPQCLQELGLFGHHRNVDVKEVVLMMSSWLESSGLDGLLVAARLLLERTTLPELHLLQAWCDRELATQKVSNESARISRELLVLRMLSRVMGNLCGGHDKHVLERIINSHENQITCQKNLPLGTSYGAASRLNLPVEDGAWWDRLILFLLQSLFFGALEYCEQDLIRQYGSSNPYQVSYQMFTDPELRSSKQALKNRILEWIFPLFALISQVEKAAIDSLSSKRTLLGKQVRKLQFWRSALWMCCNGSVWMASSFRIEDIDLDVFSYVWLKIRRLLRTIMDDGHLNDATSNRLQHTSRGIDVALDLPHEPPAPSLLWQFSGHPVLPRSQSESDSLIQLYKIAQDLSLGKLGFSVGSHVRPTIFGLICTALDLDVNELPTGESDREQDKLEAIMASLLCDSSLRRSLWEGLSMAASSCSLYHKDKPEPAGEILAHLQQAIISSVKAIDLRTDQKQTEDVTAGLSPATLFPPSCLGSRVYREYQKGLLMVEQSQMSNLTRIFPALTFQTLAHGAMLDLSSDSELNISKSEISAALSSSICSVLEDNSTSAAQVAPLQCLQWLTEISQPEEHWTNWVHDLWHRWHCSLWENSLQDIPVDTRFGLADGVEFSPAALKQWSAAAGASLVYQATLSIVSPALLNQPASIAATPAKTAQLRLAARRLFNLSTASARQSTSELYSILRKSLTLLYSQILLAHISSLDEEQDMRLKAILARVLMQASSKASACDEAIDVEGIIDHIRGIAKTSTHTGLRSCLESVAIPCLRTILKSYASGQQDMISRTLEAGKMWALLGCLRLQLVLPPQGLDPSGRASLKLHHIKQNLEHQIVPELQIRVKLRDLPGGWSESRPIEFLRSKHSSDTARITKLGEKCVLRPTPSQYRQLQEELRRFMGTLGSVPRIVGLVEKLEKNTEHAVNEARTWEDSARGLCDRLSVNYPLYRDILQPVQLAFLEICHGFSAMSCAAQMAKATESGESLNDLVGALVAFPTGCLYKGAIMDLATRQKQYECSRLVAKALATMNTKHQDLRRTSFSVRISMLRMVMQRAAKDAIVNWVISKSFSALQHLGGIFESLLQVWEELGAYQAAKEEEEAQLFKTKTKTTSFITDEERQESDYQTLFPDHWSAFHDLLELGKEEVPGDKMEIDDDPSLAHLGEAEASSKSAQSLMAGDLLNEVVSHHLNVYSALGGSSVDHWDIRGSYQEQYNLGTALLASAGGVAPRSLDDQTIPGHLLQICKRVQRLSESPKSEAGLPGHSTISLEEPNVSEAKLSRDPLLATVARLDVLLEEWPEHPLLAQLKEIAERILGFDIGVPLKKILVGIELLIARSQVWEESAAKHVSLGEELKNLTGLANRWRRLELSNWKTLLDRRIQTHSQGAWKSWFHIYRLVMVRQDSDELEAAVDIMSALEQFLQTSTVGEFAERLRLLSVFQIHLKLSQGSPMAVQLSNIVDNLVNYYREFAEPVGLKLKDGLEKTEKEVKDFVKLAKWEDRGFYAMKHGADRAQRKLHKLCLNADKVLNIPFVIVLTEAQQKLSLRHLETPNNRQDAGSDSVFESEACEIESQEKWKSYWIQRVEECEGPRPGEHIARSLNLDNSNLRYNKLPRLISRMHKIVGSLPKGLGNEGSDLDELASMAVSRSLELSKDSSKAAKSRKRKALSDFLKAVSEAGVSKRRSAIPRGEREMFDRFKHPVPCLDAFWKSAAVVGSLPEVLVEHAASQWGKSRDYHLKTLARVQKLLQGTDAPVKDISATERASMVRYSQHALYLVDQQRSDMHRLMSLVARIDEVATVLQNLPQVNSDTLPDLLPFPPQKETAHWRSLQANLLERLHGSVEDTMELLSSVTAVEWTQEEDHMISKGTSLLNYCKAQIDESIRRLGLSNPVTDLYLHRNRHNLIENFNSFQSLYLHLHGNEVLKTRESGSSANHQSRQRLSDCLPGWLPLMDTLKDVADVSSQALNGSWPWDNVDQTAGPSIQDYCSRLEQCTEAMLIWAQAHEGAKDALDESADRSILDCNEAILANANVPRAEDFCDRLCALVKTVAEICDCSRQCSEGSVQAEVVSHMSRMLRRFAPGVAIVQGGICREVVRMVCLHKSVAKLAMVMSSIFLSLVSEGFCTQEAQEEGADDQETGALTEVEGTGIGEGKGKDDVSKEMEDEDQVLGAQPENKDGEEEKPEHARDENATGVEMDQDFEGEFEDLEGNDEQSGPDEEGDDDRLDDEMGQVGDQGDAVDERLWDQEDNKEPEGGPNDDEVDDNATAPVTDKSQLDYMEGQDEGDQKDGESKEELRKDHQQQRQECDDGDEDAEFPDDGEESEMGEEGPDQYQKEGLTKPEIPDQEMELPEDLNMDGDQDMETDQKEFHSGSEEEPPVQEGSFPDEEKEEKGDPGKDGVGDDAQANANEEEESGVEQGAEDECQEDIPENDKANEDPVEAHPQVAPNEAPEGEIDEEGEKETEDPGIVQKEDSRDAVDGEEGGPKGEPVGTAEDAERIGAGAEEGQPGDLEEGAKNTPKADMIGADQGLQSIEEAPQSNPANLGPAGVGMKGAPAPANDDGRDEGQGPKPPNLGSNPYRALGNAMEKWKANLSTVEEADQKQDESGGDQDREDQDEGGQEGGEYQFLAEGEHVENEAQTLAAATEEQMNSMEAWDRSREDGMDEDEVQHETVEDDKMEDVQEDSLDKKESNKFVSGRAPASSSKTTMNHPDEEAENENRDMSDGPGEPGGIIEEERREANGTEQGNVIHVERASAFGANTASFTDQEPTGGLPPDQVEEIRTRIDQQLQNTSKLSEVNPEGSSSSQDLWNQCQALTSNLVGELTEHLRIILEPTQASRLAGDYRSGKRINMKKVLAYVASQYRKDKIWMRRTKPDKRKYQVILAIDDSKSMAENGCGVFALESLTLLCRAMSRLEVGELGVMNFGSAGHVNTLHPLGAPFTDASGPGIIGNMRFDQDNSIQDQPMVELIAGLDHMLNIVQQQHSSGGFGASGQSLHQLVLVIADGRFHERDTLKQHAHNLCNRKGVLVTFIVLDNPQSSLLDLSTVSFVDGQPQFSKYLDDFPFPLYIVLRDTMSLPRTLADLLRQWFLISSS